MSHLVSGTYFIIGPNVGVMWHCLLVGNARCDSEEHG